MPSVQCAGLLAKMLCSLNVSVAVKCLVYAGDGTVQTVYASVHIMVLGSQFSTQYAKIFFFSRSIIGFQHAVFIKVQVALTKFWKRTKRT